MWLDTRDRGAPVSWWPEMPWQAARRRFEMLLDQFAITHQNFAELGALIARPKPPEPGPYVNILVIAIGPNERRITLGRAGRVDGERTFDMRSYYDLKDVSIIVFADPERVSVVNFAVGNEVITASAGECPMAYVPSWLVGLDLFVRCRTVR